MAFDVFDGALSLTSSTGELGCVVRRLVLPDSQQHSRAVAWLSGKSMHCSSVSAAVTANSHDEHNVSRYMEASCQTELQATRFTHCVWWSLA